MITMHGTLSTVLLTALAPISWGTTYVVATELLPPGRPLLAATVRMLPVGLLLACRRGRLARPTGDWWWKVLVLGALNLGIFQALLFVAAFRLPGGVAATMGAIQPLLASALAAVVLTERFTLRTGLAGLAGIGGVGLLVLRPEAALDTVGVLAGLGATSAMAVGVVLTRHWGRPVDLLTFTGWQLVVGGVLVLPLALGIEGVPPTPDTSNLVGFTWLAVVGTGVAYALWFRGIGRLPIATTSFLGLLSPVVATLLGWLLLDQRLTPWQLLGAVLVAAAVAAPKARRRGRSSGSPGPLSKDGQGPASGATPTPVAPTPVAMSTSSQ